MDNLSGRVLGNRYLLLEKVGEGGMALVYKAKCQLLNRYVAIKILRPEFTTDEEFVKKFRRESLAAASLSHSNIVGIYDVGEQEGIYYIVMEYIAGQTLKEYIKKRGKLYYRDALSICYQIALALEHAHKNGVVHRDIKPHNILITDDKIVKVTDFGIARASTTNTMTNTGKVMGSVHYFSPEQARGGYSDHRTDIYSLGVVMYEILTGRLPYDADSPISIALKHIQENFEEPSEVDDTIPSAVNDIVVRAMEKDMSLRYQSAREMLDDIIKAEQEPFALLRNKIDDIESTRVISTEEIDKEIGKKKDNKKYKVEDKLKDKNAAGKGNNKYKKPIIITTIAMLVFIALYFFAYQKFFVVKEVKVPAIIGMKVEEAKKSMDENKLVLEIMQKENSDKPEGEILKVFPDVGTLVKESSVVKVVVSAGQQKVKIPDLFKYDLSSVDSELINAGLKKGNVERRYSEDVPKDSVIEQYPKAGEEVDAGTTVNIVVSDGPQVKFVTVPVLTGRTLEEAKKELKKYKLVLGGNIKYDSDSRFVDGVIIDQDVSAGTQVKEGTVITITINKIETNTDATGNGENTENQNNNNNTNIPVTPPDSQNTTGNQ